MSLTALWAGLTLGSFLYQYFGPQNYERVLENGYDAACILLVVWLCMKIQGYKFVLISHDAPAIEKTGVGE